MFAINEESTQQNPLSQISLLLHQFETRNLAQFNRAVVDNAISEVLDDKYSSAFIAIGYEHTDAVKAFEHFVPYEDKHSDVMGFYKGYCVLYHTTYPNNAFLIHAFNPNCMKAIDALGDSRLYYTSRPSEHVPRKTRSSAKRR